MDPQSLARVGIAAEELPGAAHAAEHAAIGMLPLFAACDRWDIGGVSTAEHPQTGLPTILIYDGFPGGAGYAAHAHSIGDEWLSATRDAVARCDCAAGCPRCVMSPKCGNGNNPLDKGGAVRLLELCAAGWGPSGLGPSGLGPSALRATGSRATASPTDGEVGIAG